MDLEYREARIEDAELLISIYNSAFYSDYIKYGECPGYGKTKEEMERSILSSQKFIIVCDGKPVGVISCKKTEPKTYEVGCLCVLPEYQGKGIGTKAFQFALSYYHDWERFTLITPADKDENVRFYTEKCGFSIESTEFDGKVKVYRFLKERSA
jgi:ribosomal protein S18 acetylase RimI-like enzyme